MRTLIITALLIAANFSYAAVVGPVQFSADVGAFDKTWVHLKADNKKFRVPRKRWEALNGPVRTGPLTAHIDPQTYQAMVWDQEHSK